MKKVQGALTETGRYRRLFAAFAVVFLVASLIGGGFEALAPQMETDDAECAPTLEVVLVEPRVLKDDNVVRITRRPPVARPPTTFFPVATGPTDSQVVSLLRDGGRQRARHPTGPPAIFA